MMTPQAADLSTALVYACDEAYLPAVCFSIRSVAEVTPDVPKVFIMTTGVSAPERSKAEQYLKSLQVDATLLEVGDDGYRWGRTNQQVSKAAYLRLAIDRHIPASFQRVLYLDADTFAVSDLRPLLQVNLQGKTIGASIEPIDLFLKDPDTLRKNCGLKEHQPYFNSGVMLLDMERWRKEAVGERVADFCVKHPERCVYFDQCALNCLMADDWIALDPGWNMSPQLLAHCQSKASLHPSSFWVGILHFIAPPKPWKAEASPQVAEHNRKYLDFAGQSPWPEFAQKSSGLTRLAWDARSRMKSARQWLRGWAWCHAPGLLSDQTRARMNQVGVPLHAAQAGDGDCVLMPTANAVVYATDAGYLPLVCFSIRSLAQHHIRCPDVFVLTDGELPAEELDKARAYLDAMPVTVRFVPVTHEARSEVRTDERIPWASYLRLLLGDHLPAGYDRVLYLDADTRVNVDLTPLFQTDLKGCAVGAVHDIYMLANGPMGETREKLGLPDGASYFNAGMLLVDLAAWNERGVGSRAMSFAVQQKSRCLYHDQCALNHVLVNDWLPLDFRWNFFTPIREVMCRQARLRVPDDGFIYHHVVVPAWKEVRHRSVIRQNLWYGIAARQCPWPDIVRVTPLRLRLRLHLKAWRRWLKRRLGMSGDDDSFSNEQLDAFFRSNDPRVILDHFEGLSAE